MHHTFENLFTNKIQESLKNLCIYLDRHDSEELYQEATVRMYLNFHKFERDTNFLKWGKTVVRNHFINKKKSQKRSIITLTETFANSSFATENDYYTNSATEDVDKFFHKCNEMVQNMNLIEAKIQGKKYREMAKELKVPIGTIKSRIHMARSQMKEMAIASGVINS